jgi:hypothetical protein
VKNHKETKKLTRLLPIALLSALGVFTTSANAQFAAVGLPDPVNHFPSYVSDVNGLNLTMCLTAAFCPPAGIIGGNAWSVLTGFGPEAFYNLASAKVGNGGNAPLLVLALEAGYLPVNVIADGNQNVFGRIRVRSPVPGPGTYMVTHPWAPTCAPVPYVVPAGSNTINQTDDYGGGAPFNAILAAGSPIGPRFISWSPGGAVAPAGFVGDPNVLHPIIGAVCPANNTFKITGPLPATTVVASQSNFSVSGKIYNAGGVAPPLVLNRATYDRTATATRVNVFGQSTPTATVALASVLGEAAGLMTTDGTGNYFRSVAGVGAPPASVSAAAIVGGLVTARTLTLTDSIDVDPAVYNSVGQTVTVTARSSDKTSPGPVLTAKVGAQTAVMTALGLGNYTATFVGVVVPPTSVSVTSSNGGSDSEAIAD